MNDTLTPSAPVHGTALSPVRTIPAPRPSHVEALAEDIGTARLLLDAGDAEGAAAVLAVTRRAMSNLAAAMVTR